MGTATGTSASSTRRSQLDDIAGSLPRRAATLSRLFISRTSVQMSRTEVGVMQALEQRPWRITELAAHEGVTQPAITLLVNRLQERGWVEREHDPSDGRAVLAKMTEEGRGVFDALRAEYRELLGEQLAILPDEDVATLARAVEILEGLIDRLQER